MSKFILWLTHSTCKNAKRKPQWKKSMCVNYTTVLWLQANASSTRWTTELPLINTTVSILWCRCSPNSFGVKWSRNEAVSRMLNPCPEFDISSQLHPAEEEHAVASSVKCWLSTTLGELRWDSGCEGEFNPPTLVRGDERLLSEVTVAVLEVAVVDRCC